MVEEPWEEYQVRFKKEFENHLDTMQKEDKRTSIKTDEGDNTREVSKVNT